MAVAPAGGQQRIVALAVVLLMIVVPALWIAWSLSAASAVADTIQERSETLAALQARLAALAAGAEGDQAKMASVYLPGETPAIAGATLQRIVADTVESAGGRLAESEIISRTDAPEEEPGAVNLRVSFETDIVGLQRVVFELETGAPILMLQSVTIDATVAAAEVADQSPALSVVLVVRGYWEA